MNHLKRSSGDDHGGAKRPRDDGQMQSLRPGSQNPTNVILIRVSNIFYPVTIDALFAIFRRFGPVEKIVMFDKGAGFQALVQYPNEEHAKAAYAAVDCQDMYTNCNTIRVGFSNLNTITVKTNNDRSWDFSTGQLPPPLPPPVLNGQIGPGHMAQMAQAGGQMYGLPPGMQVGAPFNPAMGMPGMMSMPNNPVQMIGAPYQLPTPAPVQTQKPPGWGQPPLTLNVSGTPIVPVTSSVSSEWNQPPNTPSVVMVQQVDPFHVTPEALAALFGLYGDVLKVKIMGQKESALIQYQYPLQANNAVQFLNGTPLSGKVLRVLRSTSFEIKDVSASDFSMLAIHRYRGIDSPSHMKYQQALVPPSRSLIVENLPPQTSQHDLIRLFGQYGKVVAANLYPDRRQATVEMESIEAAVHGLIMTHHFKLENSVLCVSFSP